MADQTDILAENEFGKRDPDERGYYGAFGGRFVPETLMAAVEELEQAYLEARADPAFVAELDRLRGIMSGRPTPFTRRGAAASMASRGPRIFLKREDLPTRGPTRSTTRWPGAPGRPDGEASDRRRNGAASMAWLLPPRALLGLSWHCACAEDGGVRP